MVCILHEFLLVRCQLLWPKHAPSEIIPCSLFVGLGGVPSRPCLVRRGAVRVRGRHEHRGVWPCKIRSKIVQDGSVAPAVGAATATWR